MILGENMFEIQEKYQLLQEALSNLTLYEDLKKAYQKVMADRELVEKINTYHATKDEKVRLEVYQDPAFKEYKRIENELNFLILKMNAKFKELKEGLDESH